MSFKKEQTENSPFNKTVENLNVSTEIYTIDDSKIGYGEEFLGNVVIFRKGSSKGEFSESGLDNTFKLRLDKRQKPLLRESLIADSSQIAQIKMFSYLEAQISTKEVFQLSIVDQMTGTIINNKKYQDTITDWLKRNSTLRDDPTISRISIVKSFVQKNIIRKKFKMTNFKGGAGYLGVKVENNDYQSSEEFGLDVIFGLNLSADIKGFMKDFTIARLKKGTDNLPITNHFIDPKN